MKRGYKVTKKKDKKKTMLEANQRVIWRGFP